MNFSGRQNLPIQGLEDMGLARIQIGGRRKSKNLPYETKIMNALREVLSEGDLFEIRNKTLRGLKKYSKQP